MRVRRSPITALRHRPRADRSEDREALSAGTRRAGGRALLGTLVLGALLAPIPLVGAAATDGSDTAFPDPALGVPVRAGLGTCFARVSLPAQWEIERVEIERRAADTRFEVRPAEFGPRKRRVVVRDAATEIRVVPPVLEPETRHRELRPARTGWVRGGLDGELPLGRGDRLDLIAAGIDLETLPTGTCVVEGFRPARVETTLERVLVREASEELDVVEAVFETVSLPLVTRPAHTRLIHVPTVWNAGTQRVVTRAASGALGSGDAAGDSPLSETRSRVTVERTATLTRVAEPAVRESVEVRRLVTDAFGVRRPLPAAWDTLEVPRVVAPGEFVWRIENAPPASGEEPPLAAAHADEEPRLTGRRVCHREWPAETLEYERLVEREAGRFERERLPAEHVVHDVQALLRDAHGTRIEVPAVVETLERRVARHGPSAEWRAVLCATDVTPPLVDRLQEALAREGFSPGTVDGQLGPGTTGAVERYQRANDLATGAVTIETLEALGVEP